MVWVAKDDKITEYRHVPRPDLLRNQNCLLVEAEHGGHCDFFSKHEPGQSQLKFKRASSDLIIKYFDCIAKHS
jgi:predicted alpha/beta-fold hydrolase